MEPKLNQTGIDLIKQSEGLRLKAYKDIKGILTIGYGHTGVDVTPDLVWTKEQAEKMLEQDLTLFCTRVRNLLGEKCYNLLTDNQFSALISFAYNIGAGAFNKSTMLKYLKLYGNTADTKYIKLAADEFPRWTANGVKGLIIRREKEQDLFLK